MLELSYYVDLFLKAIGVKEEATVSLKIFVDWDKSRVVFAESDKDFVDILFSFLTLPMGTIVRVLGKQLLPTPAIIGCMNNLYKSVENLSTEAMMTDMCKRMLLRPRNLCEAHLKNLKVNLDDSNPTKFFICSNIECSKRPKGGLFSYYINARCTCGNLMNRKVSLKDADVNLHKNSEVFVSGAQKFIITDDFQIMPLSPTNSIKLLSNLGIRDVKQLGEWNLNIDLKDFAYLLERSFVSNSPLSDLFLSNQRSDSNKVMCGQHHLDFLNIGERGFRFTMVPLTVKVLTRKSDGRAIFAEAREEFVDFLFSFLTIPLGSVLTLLDGKSDMEPLSPTNSIKLLSNLGIRDVKQLGEWNLNIDLKDFAYLLERSFVSNSPLSDLFLSNQRSDSNKVMCGQHHLDFLNIGERGFRFTMVPLTVKVLTRKSDGRAIFAEAREEFVDFLFSFLTIPLGSVLTLLDGKSDMECLENLYRSVRDMNPFFVASDADVHEKLVYSGIAPEVGCSVHSFKLWLEVHRLYYFDSNSGHIVNASYFTKLKDGWTPLTLIDPRTPTESYKKKQTPPAEGFVKKPTVFTVWDNLDVTPSYSISSLKTLELPTDDLEERFVSIGKREALYLLKASLVSTTAFNDILTLLAKKPKQEK